MRRRLLRAVCAAGLAGASIAAATAAGQTALAQAAPASARNVALCHGDGPPCGFRGPATDDDECEQPSAPSGDPRAGNCISAPLTVHWHVPPPGDPACSDGIDNDGDGAIDYPDDPSCIDELDDSEITSDPPWDSRSARKVSITFAHGRRGRMVLFGRVAVEGDGPAECSAGVPVRVSRRSGGRWQPRATVTTSREGWYVAVLPDRPGRYRVSALRYEAGLVDDTYWVCTRAKHAKGHRHRG